MATSNSNNDNIHNLGDKANKATDDLGDAVKGTAAEGASKAEEILKDGAEAAGQAKAELSPKASWWTPRAKRIAKNTGLVIGGAALCAGGYIVVKALKNSGVEVAPATEAAGEAVAEAAAEVAADVGDAVAAFIFRR